LDFDDSAFNSLTYMANGYTQTVADAKDNLTTDICDGYDQLVEIEYPSPTTPGITSRWAGRSTSAACNSRSDLDV